MNVYQRPLFRQMGGPVAPEMGQMMPQGMPPAPMAATQGVASLDPRAAEAVTQVEQGAAMQAEQYGQNMMAGLDAAETPEELINAMRGNQRPLEARYGELAGLVGEADAQRTPETVLALLQPVMMMTEQGAMDSGIGELMGQMTGGIDMMDEAGAPTQMGQGVGSLMMAGVGQQPVANFSQGGAVQRFQAGGEASRLQQLYSEMLPVYQGVMGDGSEQKRLNQAQTLFDISDRFGAFAAGIDPRTGQRVQGSSAAQLAAAASGLGGQINQRVAAQDQQDRALRVAALQGAAGEFSAERADQRAAARAAAAGEKDRALGSLFDILDAEGNVVQQGVPIATQGQYAKIVEDNPGIRIVPSRTAGEPVLREIGGDLYDVTDTANPRLVLSGAADRDLREIGGSLYDLSDLENPRVVIAGPGQAPVLQNVGGALYNVTDPANPQVVVPGEGPAPVLQNVGGTLYNVTDPANPQVVVAGQADRDIREFGGNMVDITDPANPVVVMQGTEDKDIRVVGGRVIDFTDTANPAVLYEPPAEAPSGSLINIQMSDGSVRTVREDSPEADRLIDVLGGTVVSRTAAEQPSPLAQPDIMAQYAAGALSPAEEARVQEELAGRLKSVWNPETGQYEKPAVTPLIRQAEETRRTSGLPTVMTFGEEQEPVSNVTEGLDRLSQFAGTAFGTGPGLLNIVNKAFALVDANAPFPDQMEGINIVNTLNETATLAFRDMTTGRPAQDAVNQFATLSPAPGSFTGSPDSAASQIRALLDLWNRELRQSEAALNSGILSATDRATVQSGVNASADMISAYQALLRGLEGGGPGAARPNPADFRR